MTDTGSFSYDCVWSMLWIMMCPQKPKILLLMACWKPLTTALAMIITARLNATAVIATRITSLERVGFSADISRFPMNQETLMCDFDFFSFGISLCAIKL